MACLTDSIPWRGDFEQKLVYAPEKRPGFVAWVTAFPYGDGSIGISFDETLEAENPDFIPPRLEFAEAAGLGITDGERPMELIPRYQAAIMAKRALERKNEQESKN